MKFVEENDLEAAFLYLDNIIICGKDQKENGVNLEHFLEDSKRKNICYNTDKCISPPGASLSLDMSSRMEYHLPAPDRLRPLRELPFPHDSPSVDSKILRSDQAYCWMQIFPTDTASHWSV